MPIYNLIEYKENYSKISGSVWKYHKDEPPLNNADTIVNLDDDNTGLSLKFKEKIIGQTGKNDTKNVEILVPWKYLSNFWRTFEMPLIVKIISF